MNPGGDEFLDCLRNNHDDKIDKLFEGGLGSPFLDGTSDVVGTSIMNQISIGETEHEMNFLLGFDGTSDVAGTLFMNLAGVGDSKYHISHNQYQATHDGEAGPSRRSLEETTQLDEMEEQVKKTSRASHDSNTGKKKRGPPLDDVEKKRRKNIADKKHRDNKKAYLKEIEGKLKAAEEKVKDLESAYKSLNEERNSMAKKLKSAIKKMDEDKKMKEELRSLRTEICELRRMKQSSITETDTMEENFQAETTSHEQLKSTIYTMKATRAQQKQFMDLCWNELVENGEPSLNATIAHQQQELLNNVPVEQEQLWEEENGRLGFVGHRRPIVTCVSEIQHKDSEMSQQFEKLKKELEEATRNDRVETKKQTDEVLAEMRAMKATMSENMEKFSFILGLLKK